MKLENNYGRQKTGAKPASRILLSLRLTDRLLKALCIVIFVGISLGVAASQATLFRNSYVSFELPDNWKCEVEETEWVCQAQSPAQSREAVIILTAKETGPLDSLSTYSQHLKTPKKIGNNPAPSTVHFSRSINVNSHPWVDGMHFASELPNYYTRYLATVKSRVAILVTFSAHKLYYTKYSNQFYKSILSLRVVASENLLNDSRPILKPGGSEVIGVGGGAIPVGPGLDMDEAVPAEEDNHTSGTRSIIFAFAIIIAAIGVYLFIKSRK